MEIGACRPSAFRLLYVPILLAVRGSIARYRLRNNVGNLEGVALDGSGEKNTLDRQEKRVSRPQNTEHTVKSLDSPGSSTLNPREGILFLYRYILVPTDTQTRAIQNQDPQLPDLLRRKSVACLTIFKKFRACRFPTTAATSTHTVSVRAFFTTVRSTPQK